MIGFHDFVAAFRKLDLPLNAPVIAHASLSAFGKVQGGADALLGSLLVVYNTLIMPAFTYKTMITPEIGPENNGLTYGASRRDILKSVGSDQATFFRRNMPVDRLMGVIPESLRRHPGATRSTHPILSFVGVHAEPILESQTITEPLMPIEHLLDRGGWVLLLGVGQEVNTSIHYAERQAGRKQFIRWALTPKRILECPGFPGCSDGFGVLATGLEPLTRMQRVGSGIVQAIPLDGLVDFVCKRLQADPFALLCDRGYCERCEAVRQSLDTQPAGAHPLEKMGLRGETNFARKSTDLGGDA